MPLSLKEISSHDLSWQHSKVMRKLTKLIKDVIYDNYRFNIIMLLFAWSVAVEQRQTWYLSLTAKLYRINVLTTLLEGKGVKLYPRRCKVIAHGVWRDILEGWTFLIFYAVLSQITHFWVKYDRSKSLLV